MSEIHEILDGDGPTEPLSLVDPAELAEMKEAIAEAVAPLRAEPVPDLTPRVMARIKAAAVAPRAQKQKRIPGSGGFVGWLRPLWQPIPVTIRFRPALAAALVVTLVPLGVSVASRLAPPVESISAALPDLFVHFRLDMRDARSVALAGSFTDWAPRYELRESSPGVWSILVPLSPGVHQYGFVIDGERWVADPLSAQIDDGFGGVNSQLSILAPGGSL